MSIFPAMTDRVVSARFYILQKLALAGRKRDRNKQNIHIQQSLIVRSQRKQCSALLHRKIKYYGNWKVYISLELYLVQGQNV